MIPFFAKRPWLWIVLAFVILISGWVVLFRLAAEHRPESVPIVTMERSETNMSGPSQVESHD